MKKIVVDTNALLRFFLNDLPQQKKAVEALLLRAKQAKVKLLIAQITIFELCFVLDKYYHFKKEEIVERLKVLISTDYLYVESREIFLSALILYAISTNSFVDCFLVTTAQEEKAELFSFDRKLDRFKN